MDHHYRLEKLGLFDARVPRYTSYPTAPQFGSLVGPSDLAAWVAAIPEGSEVSLYVHVPFCRRLCWFCACRTQGTSSLAPVEAYIEVLLSEIMLLASTLPKDIRLSRLHWGGGTPTLLSPEQMSRLAAAIFAVLPLAKGAEFSVEIDPNEIDAARMDALIAAGMTRASIGVQDFDPMIQKVIGREQSYELTRDVALMLRERGIQSLNADILYGLPHQTEGRIRASVEKLISLSPDRVALYGYAHVPWMSRRQQMLPSDAMPTPQERLRLFDVASELFIAAGYEAIGIDHFARPGDGLARAAAEGRLRRNFQGYTDDTSEVLIGLGASSISRFPQGYAQNASATAAYTAAVRGGAFATGRGHVFDADDHQRGRIIEALMCDFRVDRAELARMGLSAEAQDELLSEAVAVFGPEMVRLSPEALEITEAGRPLTRMIARLFDAYDQSKAQHSAAV